MPEPELWTIDQAAAYLGAATDKSATSTLSRWGIAAVGYERSPNGRPRALYSADQIRAKKATRPGRGARTDLNPYPLMALLGGYGHPARWDDNGSTVTTMCGKTGTPDAINPDGTFPYCTECANESAKEASP